MNNHSNSTGATKSPSFSSASASASASGASTPTSSNTSSSLHHDSGHANHSSSPLAQILMLYHKATSAFLLRQLASAYSTCFEALELLVKTNQAYGLDQVTESLSARRSFFVLKQKLWILNVTIFGAMLSDRAEDEAATVSGGLGKRLMGSSKKSPEKLVQDLWRRLNEDYGGLEGDVDGQVMVAFVMLCINQKLYTAAKQITEAYLATIPEDMMIHLETAAGALTSVERATKDPLIIHYERLVELYAVHVLAKLREWDCARHFLEFNPVLSESSKKTYGKILDKLEQKSLRPKKSKKPVASALDQSSAPSIASTPTILSPALTSASTFGSTAVPDVKNASLASPATTSVVANEGSVVKSGPSSINGRTKTSVPKADRSPTDASRAARTTVVPASTLQGWLWALLQRHVDQIRSAGAQMGASQMMVVVGVVVFLGALSRNRARASTAMRMVVDKVMQTVKMGTTVTSI
ncbi:hypothetical protein EDD21DRAFT_414374 [Dissophora ornata]|nr:hypothetical protein BGZ58_009057 [Dissophora ornata]KAI8602011.1 hypothetical protein EDD21DRAFT_414374 [Dissophora ornata]